MATFAVLFIGQLLWWISLVEIERWHALVEKGDGRITGPSDAHVVPFAPIIGHFGEHFELIKWSVYGLFALSAVAFIGWYFAASRNRPSGGPRSLAGSPNWALLGFWVACLFQLGGKQVIDVKIDAVRSFGAMVDALRLAEWFVLLSMIAVAVSAGLVLRVTRIRERTLGVDGPVHVTVT